MTVTKIWRWMHFLIRVDLPCTLFDEPRHFVQRFRRVSTLSLVLSAMFPIKSDGCPIILCWAWRNLDARGCLGYALRSESARANGATHRESRGTTRAENFSNPGVTVLQCYFLDSLKVDGRYMVVAVKNPCEKREASRCDLSHHRGGSTSCNTVTL